MSAHRRRLLPAALPAVLAGALLALALTPAAPAGAAVTNFPQGPSGTAFYSAPSSQIPGARGSLIWARESPEPQTNSRTYAVLYRSVGSRGQAVSMSGTVHVPTGNPPAGGWPVIAWGHGFVGAADSCAPSRPAAGGGLTAPYGPTVGYTTQVFLDNGYAVVQPDFEGLGTPGPHAFYQGGSEGRAMVDAVRAARALDTSVGSRWLAAGNSMGAHAVLHAADEAKSAPDLQLQGALAMGAQARLSRAIEEARVNNSNHLTGQRVLAVRASAQARGIDPATLWTPQGASLVAQFETTCDQGLVQADSFGGVPINSVIRRDADLSGVYAAMDAADPMVTAPTAPVALAVASEDEVVPYADSVALAQHYWSRNVPLTAVVYDGADHSTLPQRASGDAFWWIGATMPVTWQARAATADSLAEAVPAPGPSTEIGTSAGVLPLAEG